MKKDILVCGEFTDAIQELGKDNELIELHIKEAREQSKEFVQGIAKAEILITRSGCAYGKDVLEKAKNLKHIIFAGTGTDMIDAEYCKEQEIEVENIPGANAESVAELTIGLMLAIARRIPEADESMRRGEWKKSELVGTELAEKTVAILAYGNIGRRVAHALLAFGCKVKTFDPVLLGDKNPDVEEGVEVAKTTEEAVKDADYITVHVPLIPQTKGMIGREFLDKTKQGVRIINMARGEVLDKDAILEALQREQISGLAIDTWWEEPPKDNPFIEYKNVIMTPHIGGTTKEALERITKGAVELAQKRLTK